MRKVYMSRSRTLLRTAMFAIFSISIGLSPSLARPLSAIKSDGVLKVGMTGDYPPFALRKEGGDLAGADVMMADELAKALGVKLVIVPTTWKTLSADFQAEKFDVAMGGVSETPDRAALGEFSIPVLRDGKRPIV